MITINVVKLIGSSSLLSSNKGITLYEELNNFLKEHRQITLDFFGSEYLSTIFINHSLGQLCVDMGWDITKFYEHFNIINISEEHQASIELAISNAYHRYNLIAQKLDPKEYYSSTCSY